MPFALKRSEGEMLSRFPPLDDFIKNRSSNRKEFLLNLIRFYNELISIGFEKDRLCELISFVENTNEPLIILRIDFKAIVKGESIKPILEGTTHGRDLYSSTAIRHQIEYSMARLDSFLESVGINRLIVPFKDPVEFRNYPEILDRITKYCTRKYNEELGKHFSFSAGQFFKKQILGELRWKRIEFLGPAKSNILYHSLHAAEFWITKSNASVMTAFYGTTDPKTTIVDTSFLGFDVHKLNNQYLQLSSAFTLYKGIRIFDAYLGNILGRRNFEGDTQEVEKRIKEIAGYSNPYHYWQEDFYHSFPFTVPIDAVLYPHAEEFETLDYYSLKYLKPSLYAKLLIKAYFEWISKKSFPITESLVMKLIEKEEHKSQN